MDSAAAIDCGPDIEVIDLLCDRALMGFSLNKDILYTWQSELSHEADNYDLLTSITNEIILLFPENSSRFKSSACEALQECIVKIDELDTDIYYQLKILLYFTIYEAITPLLTIKLQLEGYSFTNFLIRNITSFIETLASKPSKQNFALFAHKKQLLMAFMSLGCDARLMKQLLLPILQMSSLEISGFHLQVLTSALQLIKAQPSYLLINNFTDSRISLPYMNESPLQNCFSITSWFKVISLANTTDMTGNDLSCVTLFLLTSANDPSQVTFMIQLVNLKKIVLVLYSSETKSKMTFSFNIVLIPNQAENQGFTHIVLTYDLYQNLNLFVDGEYSESIPCPSLAHYPSRWNKLCIGSLPDEINALSPFSRSELALKDLNIIDKALPYEWISFLYALGVGYNWSYKDINEQSVSELLSHMEFKNFTNFEVRMQHIMDESKLSTSYFKLPSSAPPSTPPQALKSLQTHSKTRMIKALMNKKLKRENFLFDLYDLPYIYTIESALGPHIFYHKATSIQDSLFALGGGGLFLVMLESTIKDENISVSHKSSRFLNITNLLLQFLENHPVLAKEFQDIEGYWILSLMANNFKTNHNSQLNFKNYEETSRLITSDFDGILSCFLNHIMFGNPNTNDLRISNIVGYKCLILNFEFFLDTCEFPQMVSHLRSMLSSQTSQMKELCGKMRLSNKVCQLLRKHVVIETTRPGMIKEFDVLVRTILEADPSAEAIKSFAEFVILALYHHSSNQSSQQLGLNVLSALNDKFCDSKLTVREIRKFSRSMSIYWILLLFDFRSDSKQFAGQIICFGVSMLAKLLKVLGAPITRKFVIRSKGLDVLTLFLSNWWNDDRVLACILTSSLESDLVLKQSNQKNIYLILESETFVSKSQKVALPEFILLLNNLALLGGYTLAQKQGKVLSAPNSPMGKSATPELYNSEVLNISFDWLHLMNQLSRVIETQQMISLAFQRIFFSKEWLESIFELVAYMKILRLHALEEVKDSFNTTYDRFITAISLVFISKLLDIKLIVAILKLVNDITGKLIYENVFPKMFNHLMLVTFSTQFVFNEADLMRGSVNLMEFFYEDYLKQNFCIAPQELDLFIECACAILDKTDTTQKTKRTLGPIVAHSIVIKLSNMTPPRSKDPSIEESYEAEFREQLDNSAKFCLYKQSIFMQPDVVSDDYLRQVIELLMGFYLKLSTSSQLLISEHVLNFVRACVMMRSETFDWIIDRLIDVSDYKNSKGLIKEFFDNIVTKNDEDTVRYLQKFPTVKQIFNKSWQFRMRKLDDVGSVKMIDMIKVVLGNGGLVGNLAMAHIEKFKGNCDMLKATCLNDELMKFGREQQDKQEADIFASASFSTVKSEILRHFAQSSGNSSAYSLHDTEGVDRMRHLLVQEDQIPESERLSYAISVPIKPAIPSTEEALKGLNIPVVLPKKNTLHILDASLVDLDLEEYEDIDENGEVESLASSNVVYEDRNRKVLRSLYMGDHIQNLFNVSRIQGLDPVESLMIMGYTHLYLIEHYFHCANGNVIDVEEAPRDLRDPYIQLIKPVSSSASKSHGVRNWPLNSLSCISRRKFLLRDIGLEMFFCDGASILITCTSTKQRDSIYSLLSSYATGKGLDKDLAATLEISSSPLLIIQEASRSGSFFSSKLASAFSTSSAVASRLQELTQKWKEGKMSNFFYLIAVNTMAGRTFNDLSQYPVFPWVIADYHSQELDFNDPKTFRDLSKPMGAQSTARAQEFQERFEALKSFEDPRSPSFHYGTHYSSAMIVSSYLIRMKPFVQSYLLLQGGSFDHADRLFNSVGKAWLSASKENTTDVRELIPEFFYMPEFLVNSNHFEFGNLQNGTSVNDVELPPWANGDPKVFIAKNREALESTYVSKHLHHWIDLIFGYKQNGPEAVKALNVFHHLSYEGAINLDIINDEVEKRAMIGMINNFGQTPLKLFSKPHTPREVLNLANKYLLTDPISKSLEQTFESKLQRPIEKIEYSSKTRKWIGRPACTSSEDDILIRKPDAVASCLYFGNLLINNIMHCNLHLSEITAILQIGDQEFLTGSKDGVIKAWKCLLEHPSKITLQSILRGHLYPIRSLILNKSFHVGLSMDFHGGLIIWDLTRLKFVRQVNLSENRDSQCKRFVAVSNDTGNFCVLISAKFSNSLNMYTLNGEQILRVLIEPGIVTSVAFAQVNKSLIDISKPEYMHSFWSNEYISVSYSSPRRVMHMYEIMCGSRGFSAQLIQTYDMSTLMTNTISAMIVNKETTFDDEEKLSRGQLEFVLGDSKGRVFKYK